jgi:hypothetical protein
MQNWGFENGLPFTKYRKGLNARAEMEAFLRPRLEAALLDRAALDASDSIVARMLRSLEEEGLQEGSARCAGCAHTHAEHAWGERMEQLTVWGVQVPP